MNVKIKGNNFMATLPEFLKNGLFLCQLQFDCSRRFLLPFLISNEKGGSQQIFQSNLTVMKKALHASK